CDQGLGSALCACRIVGRMAAMRMVVGAGECGEGFGMTAEGIVSTPQREQQGRAQAVIHVGGGERGLAQARECRIVHVDWWLQLGEARNGFQAAWPRESGRQRQDPSIAVDGVLPLAALLVQVAE